ncbi:hypothetical protein AUJ46_04860 [Candidatus Peregrinibacteria bacterium CG1_02_54_53]|nr:MAG: hypothetical protein AUJ46_04860 [Candidatus Peregrinibacteria bacterium CG1_02_54_53]
MPEFPFASGLLGDLVSRESHTPHGERAIAEYIAQLAKRWNLGVVNVHEYPDDAPFADLDPPPLNVTIDINSENIAKPGEILEFGHFDSIDPATHYPPEYQGDPYQLILDRNDRDIAHGLKSADMAAGIVSMLLAAWQIKEHRSAMRHSVRILLVGGEEGQSHGIYAALDSHNNLAAGARAAISTDIEVGTQIDDVPLICIGRPGRIGLRLIVKGKGMHVGKACGAHPTELVAYREAAVKLALHDITFPQREEEHFRALMPKTAAVARDWRPGNPEKRTEVTQQNMSVPGAATIDIDVVNGNPALSSADIIDIIREGIDRKLREFGITSANVFEFRGESGRRTPHLKPYLEHPDHTWVKTVAECMSSTTGVRPMIKAGKGTADEGAVVHGMGIPTVILPPICEGEHTADECVRISSIERNARTLAALPFLEGPLTHVEPSA